MVQNLVSQATPFARRISLCERMWLARLYKFKTVFSHPSLSFGHRSYTFTYKFTSTMNEDNNTKQNCALVHLHGHWLMQVVVAIDL